MAISFPTSPTVNDTYTYNSKTWTWDGTVWRLTTSVVSVLSTPATSVTVSSAAPSTTTAGNLWFDPEYNVLSVYANSTWVDATHGVAPGASFSFNGGVPSSVYTVGPVFDCGGVI